MLTLLNPMALLGLGLLAIPIAIHLFAPRKVRQTPFSSLRWLKASQHRKSKRIRWHQLLLFLLRAFFITAIVVAIAHPILTTNDSAGPIDRIIIIDTGRSMAYQSTEGDTPIALAVEQARRLLQDTVDGERAAVIIAEGRGARIAGPLTAQTRDYLNALDQVVASPSPVDASAALAVVNSLLETARPEASVELVFITDARPGFWSQDAISQFQDNPTIDPQRLAVRVVDVSPDTPSNAWIAEARVMDRGEEGGRAMVVTVAGSSRQAMKRELKIDGIPGVAAISQPVTLEPKQSKRLVFPLSPELELDAQVAELRLEPADALRDDDRYWVTLQPESAARKVLIVQGPSTGIASPPGRVYLTSALDALRATQGIHAQITVRTDSEVAADDVAQADAVLLAGVPTIGPDLAQLLRQHAARGGSLVVFVGPGLDAASYDATGLMPAMIGQPRQRTNAPSPIVSRVADHALTEGLFDPAYSDLSRVSLRTWLELSPRPESRTLLTIGQDTPLLMTLPIGDGVCVLVNTSANDAWSDLVRRGAFLPLLDRMMNATAGNADTELLIGRPIVARLKSAASDPQVSITAPDNQPLGLRTSTADATVAISHPTRQAGVYQLSYQDAEGEARSFAVAVRTDRSDSALSITDTKTLAELWSGINVEVVGVDEMRSAQAAQQRPLNLVAILVLLACLALFIEMYLVHRRCPALNPVLVESRVKHGLVRGGSSPPSTPIDDASITRQREASAPA